MTRLILALILGLTVGACSDIGYYTQAVDGQMKIMRSSRPISELVKDDATAPELRQQLERVKAIREFASRELGLPDNGSYRSYADLHRPYVVWNVFAAAEFSVDPQQWCPPFVGCVSYRGYYDQNDAERYALELHQTGLDVYVAGIPAYSTLGYFNDPVLNTFLRFGDEEVARIVFHELAHQLIYADGDSAFNESFATAVENEGMRRWLTQTAKPGALMEYEAQRQRQAQFYRLIAETRDKLRVVYASPLAAEEKRKAKAAIFQEMRRTYAGLKTGWGGYGGYDAWFRQPLNNARLGSLTLYTQWEPAFRALLGQEKGSLANFYKRVTALARLSRSERAAVLDHLQPTT